MERRVPKMPRLLERGECRKGHAILDFDDLIQKTRKTATKTYYGYTCKECRNDSDRARRNGKRIDPAVPRLLQYGECLNGHAITSKADLIPNKNGSGWTCRECAKTAWRRWAERTGEVPAPKHDLVQVFKIILDCGQELNFDVGGPPSVGDTIWCRFHQTWHTVESRRKDGFVVQTSVLR